MKIKNIMAGCMAALAVLLVLLLPDDVYAGTHGSGTSSEFYECSRCGGDWQSYFREEINDPYVFYVLGHNKNSDGTWTCDNYGYNRLMDHEVGGYYIRYNVLNSDGEYDMNYGFIFISEDTNFDTTTYGGEVVVKRYSEYTSSRYAGEANNKYYIGWIHSGLYYPFELNNGDFDFIVEVDNVNNQNNQFHELARYLCGETTELPSGVTVGKQPDVKDLEPPLNVTVNGIDNKIFETKSKSVKIRWGQSNIDLTGYKTVFYMRESGRCRKTIFNEWKDISTPWLFDKDYVTAKYCNNNLKYHEYKWWTEQSKLSDYANAELYGDETGGFMCEHAAVDFMIRNEKEDENGVLHYSSWVYVNCFEDGTYQIYEMNDDYTLDKDPDETGNIKTDSDIYDDETVYDEDDVDAALGIGDAKDFVGSMSDLINSLRNFPAMFSKIFSFFPSWVLGMIGMLFIACMLARLFL